MILFAIIFADKTLKRSKDTSNTLTIIAVGTQPTKYSKYHCSNRQSGTHSCCFFLLPVFFCRLPWELLGNPSIPCCSSSHLSSSTGIAHVRPSIYIQLVKGREPQPKERSRIARTHVAYICCVEIHHVIFAQNSNTNCNAKLRRLSFYPFSTSMIFSTVYKLSSFCDFLI